MLPKIDQPLFTITIPSTGKEMLFRPFLVKEEKILLVGTSSGDEVDILTALTQVANNCAAEPLIGLTEFDVEWIFLQLRARSVNPMVEFMYKDPDDLKEYKLKLDLRTVELTKSEVEPVVMIDEEKKLGLRLKFPGIEEAKAYKAAELTQEQVLDKVIEACIEDVFDANDVFEFKQYSAEQRAQFIDSLPVPVFNKIQEFFDSTPHLKHTLTYKNSEKKERKVTLEGLNDFFTWG